MNKADFVRIISEEVSKFDFLGNDKHLKEQETTDLMLNEELQKQFICDALLNRSDKVKIVKIADSFISGNWDESNQEDADRVSLEYSLDMEYNYDSTQKPIYFNLSFNSDRIDISVDGWSDPGRWAGTMADSMEPSGEAWYDVFNWGDIEVTLHTMEDNDEVRFIAFDNAPPNIQMLFIREFTESFIETETLELRTDDNKVTIQNTPYC